MQVKFFRPGTRRFIRRETNVIPAKGRTIKWGDQTFTVASVEYDLNVTPGTRHPGALAAKVTLR